MHTAGCQPPTHSPRQAEWHSKDGSHLDSKAGATSPPPIPTAPPEAEGLSGSPAGNPPSKHTASPRGRMKVIHSLHGRSKPKQQEKETATCGPPFHTDAGHSGHLPPLSWGWGGLSLSPQLLIPKVVRTSSNSKPHTSFFHHYLKTPTTRTVISSHISHWHISELTPHSKSYQSSTFFHRSLRPFTTCPTYPPVTTRFTTGSNLNSHPWIKPVIDSHSACISSLPSVLVCSSTIPTLLPCL